MDIDDRVDSLYKLARNYPDNRELQEAVADFCQLFAI